MVVTEYDYQAIYRHLHSNDKWFVGKVEPEQINEIAKLVDEFKPRHLLDFGSGKGYQYLATRIHERWGGLLPYCYDIGVRSLRQLPKFPVDGVICTDVMEHISAADVPILLKKVFGCLVTDRPTFAMFSIGCHTSRKKLGFKEGASVHLTVQPSGWWDEKLRAYRPHNCTVAVMYDEDEPGHYRRAYRL